MSSWHVGTVVCSGCDTVLNVKSISDKIKCYLCDALVDLVDCSVTEDLDIEKDYDIQE